MKEKEMMISQTWSTIKVDLHALGTPSGHYSSGWQKKIGENWDYLSSKTMIVTPEP